MKRLLGLGALLLSISIPAHAQFRASTVGAVIGFGFGASGGGGGGALGGGLGCVNFPTLQSTPMPTFAMTYTSGTEADFVISTYLPFKQAYAAGQAAQALRPKTIAEEAEENSNTPRVKAKFIFLQDALGYPVIWPLQELEQVASDPSTRLRASK